jgi:predicted ArsR family transcriptional regulator
VSTGLGPTRRRVLAALQDATAPLSAAEAGRLLGLHANSARFHLDALVGSGMAHRAAAERTTVGRPSIVYAASAAAPQVAPRSYRTLAQILVRHLQDHEQPQAAAEAAGRLWGRELASAAAARAATVHRPATRVGAERAVVTGLESAGFRSQAVRSGVGTRVDIIPCPFLELAQANGPVVCAVHSGLMAGLLAELDAPLALERLVPFATPETCVAHLAPRPR